MKTFLELVMHKNDRQWRGWCVGAVLAVMGSAVSAESDPDNVIKYRQGVMSALGGHMGASAQIVRGKVDHWNHLLFHAESIEAISRRVSVLFPEGSDFGETGAKEVIWEEWDDFQEAARKGERAANDYLTAVNSGDKTAIGKSFRALADACKKCHKKFREEEE
jgi:cytochrome c556